MAPVRRFWVITVPVIVVLAVVPARAQNGALPDLEFAPRHGSTLALNKILTG